MACALIGTHVDTSLRYGESQPGLQQLLGVRLPLDSFKINVFDFALPSNAIDQRVASHMMEQVQFLCAQIPNH